VSPRDLAWQPLEGSQGHGALARANSALDEIPPTHARQPVTLDSDFGVREGAMPQDAGGDSRAAASSRSPEWDMDATFRALPNQTLWGRKCPPELRAYGALNAQDFVKVKK